MSARHGQVSLPSLPVRARTNPTSQPLFRVIDVSRDREVTATCSSLRNVAPRYPGLERPVAIRLRFGVFVPVGEMYWVLPEIAE
jgi:hypothetical protein